MFSEAELVRLCQQNNKRAQEELYKRFSRKLLGMAFLYLKSSDDARDVLQESFIKIFLNITQYKSEGSFEGWMRRIVVNTAISYLKSKRKMNFDSVDKIEEISADNDEDDTLTDYPDLTQEELFELVGQLPEKYRVIFVMYCIDGFSHSDIAASLQITEEGCRTRLKRAREQLRKMVILAATEKK